MLRGEREQRGAAGRGVDAGQHHRVGARAGPVGARVAADQQDVEARFADRVRHRRATAAAEEVVQQGALRVHQLRRVAEGAGDQQAQRGHDDHADGAAGRVEAARTGERVGAHDLGDPRQGGEYEPDHHDQQHAAREQVRRERGLADREADDHERDDGEQEHAEHEPARALAADHEQSGAGDDRAASAAAMARPNERGCAG
jgi:hypothetical protein